MSAPSDVRGVGVGSGRSYELLLKIASGGMATVYVGRAVDAAPNAELVTAKHVAIKVCHRHLLEDADFRRMFLNEAALAARIRHPNVVPTLDVGEGNALFLVMAYVEGDRVSTLSRAAAKGGHRFPVDVAVRVLLDALAGLHEAHELKGEDGSPLHIVHRDASPQNIIVGVDGVARILDFGVAKILAQPGTTKEGNIKGKLGYMPPEQLHYRKVGRFTDVYAAGVVLWEMLAGRRLFKGDTEGETVALVLRGAVPALGEFRPDVSAELEAVIRRAVHRDQRERFPSAREFALALEACGAPVATHEEVAMYVQRMVGTTLERRRAALAELELNGGALGRVGGVEPHPESNAEDGVDLDAKTTVSPQAESSTDLRAPSAGSRRFAWGLGAVVLVLGFGVLAFWWNAQGPAAPVESNVGAVVDRAAPEQANAPAAPSTPVRVAAEPPPSTVGASDDADTTEASKPSDAPKNAVRSSRRRENTRPDRRKKSQRQEWWPDDI
ncbi:MAG: serine/threonine-protein kinase [Polyangiales bacterium]